MKLISMRYLENNLAKNENRPKWVYRSIPLFQTSRRIRLSAFENESHGLCEPVKQPPPVKLTVVENGIEKERELLLINYHGIIRAAM
jgi:hypothetical protein